MPKVRSSRRIPSLKESDIDHEISLVDSSASIHGVAHELARRALSPDRDADPPHADHSTPDGPPLTPSESQAPLKEGAASISNTENEQEGEASFEGQGPEGTREIPQIAEPGMPTTEAGPSNAVEQPSSAPAGGAENTRRRQVNKHPHPKAPETAIDILYENERGGFLCGIPLFSGAALGNLDPAPWTNFVHKASPTDTKTAQVPDPSWEWAWPEWRINQDDAIEADGDGWEYSFMFSRKFSWHGPKWWNSFVRRRAWTRRRIKKGIGYQANDPHLLNPGYFSITSPSNAKERRQSQHLGLSEASSVADGEAPDPNKTSQRTSVLMLEADVLDMQKVDIENIDVLMGLLRRSRIDREKLEAVQNYLEHSSDDLLHLQDHMHEVMSAFVFQASRRLLLTRLMQVHDQEARAQDSQQQKGKEIEQNGSERTLEPEVGIAAVDGNDAPEAPAEGRQPAGEGEGPPQIRPRVTNLAAAIKHADEEVRRLEYWSDIKGMAENGQSRGAVEGDRGWEPGWDGIDKSGAAGANKEELPES
ncbi:meiotically up-regulated 65 protein [Xylariales sp. AK1849]|nr:meiotically up-regulated 65 protein [Xylariales sp. AK1849]